MSAGAKSPIPAAAFSRYVGALREGDARVVREVITGQLKRGVPLRHVCRDYIQEGLYEIGRLWERNEIPVAVEHLASSATQLVLSELYLKQQVALPHSPEVIIACVPGELHDVATLVIANVCENAGCRSILLGANTPMRDMLAYIQQRDPAPDLLALSVTLPANRWALEDGLGDIEAGFPGLDVLIGGQALDGTPEASRFRESLLARYPRVRYLGTLDELEHALTLLAGGVRPFAGP